MKSVVAGDAGELQGALDHAERRVAVAVHDAVAERAVVGADADRDATFFTEEDQRREGFADALQLGGVLLVGVLLDGELLGVREVARIDADFFHPARGFHGGVGFEVDVGHEGHVATGFEQAALDVLQVGSVLDRRGGDADNLGTDVCQVERLLDAGRSIHGVAGDHGLHPDRIAAADAHLTDADLAAGTAAGGTGG